MRTFIIISLTFFIVIINDKITRQYNSLNNDIQQIINTQKTLIFFKEEKDLNSLENKILKEAIKNKNWIKYVHEMNATKKYSIIESTKMDGKDYSIYFTVIDNQIFYRIEEEI